jgi:TonB-dependent starch-binding outer membrane protein SusC
MRSFVLLLVYWLFFLQTGSAQQTQIKGKVLDSKQSPIAGATVSAKGGKIAVLTDENGEFNISVGSSAQQLTVSYVGYQTQTVRVSGNAVSVSMKATDNLLNEIVVTGYANRSQRNNSGSVAVVPMDEIRSTPVASFDQLLQGQTAGIDVKSGSGQPGASADILIRGRGSINGSVVPLYVVDGVEVRAQDFSTVNPADFESITILKDAASTAIYGSRGANGVIVITTRKGRNGATRYGYNLQVGNAQMPKNKLILMNAQQKVFFEDSIAGNPWGWTPEQFDSLKNINTDWNDYVFKRGSTLSHELYASGGNEKTTFYTSFNYLDQKGTVLNTFLKRYTGRLNMAHTDGNLKIGVNLGGGWSQQQNTFEGDQSVGSPLNTVIWALPYETPYTSTGAYTNSVQFPFWINPVEDLKVNPRTNWELKLTGSAYLEYKIPRLNNLTYRLNMGGDYSQVEAFNIINNGSQSANQSDAFGTSYAANGQVRRSLDRRFIYTVTNSLNYKTFLDKGKQHALGASVYMEFLRDKGRNFDYTGYGLLLPFQNEAGLVAGTSTNGFIPTVGGGFPQNSSLLSYFGTLDYGFKDRYYLTLSARTDGSSKLSPDNRWTQYGSAGASWIVSDESFFSSQIVNLLKLKASYGSVGNQNGIGQFPYLQQFDRSTYSGKGTLEISTLGNPQLTWEKRTTTNIGVDAAFVNNRITLSLEVYRSLTSGLYFSPFVPSTSGGNGNILANSGNMENKGIEIMLGFKIIDNKAIRWTLNGNFSYNKNTIKKLPNNQSLIIAPNGLQVLQVGKPVNSFYLVRFAGVDPETGSSLYYTADGKTTTTDFSTDNRVVLGSSDAPYNGGIRNVIAVKGFELSAYLTYSFGNYIFNNAIYNVQYGGYSTSGFSAEALNAWTTPGQKTNFPIITENTQSNTTRFLENDNFWRLRNISLSYGLPETVCKKLKLQALRVFFQGQNLYTHTKFRGWDPEVSSVQDPDGGTGNYTVAGSQYPTLKTLTFGLNLGF